MPMGTRHRLEGLLLNSKRGLVLQIDDGGVWALDHDRHAAKLVGLRVVVEGTRSGFGWIEVDCLRPVGGRASALSSPGQSPGCRPPP